MTKRWICSAGIAVLVVGCTSGCDREVEKFQTKVKATIDPIELQAWATNLIASANFGGGNIIAFKQADIPAWVGSFYQDRGDRGQVTIERSRIDDPDIVVQIMYGGGFGHWGLVIGYPTMTSTNHDSCHSYLWKPGV